MWNARYLLCLEFNRKLHFPWTPASYCFTSSYPSWLFLQIPSHGPFYYLTSLQRCWDGGICVLSGVSAGKTALRAGKEFAAMLKCIFVWASLMGVDKQHMCRYLCFAPALYCESHPFLTVFFFFLRCLLLVASLQYNWPMQLFVMSVTERFW